MTATQCRVSVAIASPQKIKKWTRGHATMTPEVFWARIDKTPGHGPRGDCWIWTGATHRDGYGRVIVQGKYWATHRLAFYLGRGKMPEPFALHRCDNRPCCNPSHLFEGNNADNSADKLAKGRESRGEGNPVSKLREADIYTIRQMGRLGMSHTRLAERFGVRSNTIRQVVLGRTWRWLQDPPATTAPEASQ